MRDEEEEQLLWRLQEQQDIIQAQTEAIFQHQQRIHDLKEEQGKKLLPSQNEMYQLQAREQDLEDVRQKQRQEINEIVSTHQRFQRSQTVTATSR